MQALSSQEPSFTRSSEDPSTSLFFSRALFFCLCVHLCPTLTAVLQLCRCRRAESRLSYRGLSVRFGLYTAVLCPLCRLLPVPFDICVALCQVALDIKAAAHASGKVMCWKSHSMGCYLLLNVVDRLRWKGEDMKSLFGAVILDAPDVPTWFFSSMTKVCARTHAPGSHMLHVWRVERKSAKDNEAGCMRYRVYTL